MTDIREPLNIQDVRKSISVPVDAARAFRIFAERPLEWWPAHHKLVPGSRDAIVFGALGEPWYETDTDGHRAEWGRVLAWEPSRRLTLSWRIDGRWQPIEDDGKASEIEVSFTPDGRPGRTVVELAHVKLWRHGEYAPGIFAALDGPSPGDTLAGFGRAVERLTASGEY
jgi:uncharacterized protein YndB with AHSA1/START domain